MVTYLSLLMITFSVIVAAALTINYCKKRAASTNHGLSGMCHKSGGSMCGCCASRLATASDTKAVQLKD